MTKRVNSHSGNAVIFVLLAVALFGALSYTFMRGSKSGQGNLSQQQAKLAAQEILNYAQAIEKETNRLIQRGCGENQLNVFNTVYTYYDGSPLAANNPNSLPECNIYKTSGGKINETIFPDSYVIPASFPGTIKYGHSSVRLVNMLGLGTTATDLVFFMPHIKRDICIEINNILGIANPSNLPPTTASNNSGGYIGTFYVIAANDDPTNSFTGKYAYCVQNTSDNVYRFTYAVIVR